MLGSRLRRHQPRVGCLPGTDSLTLVVVRDGKRPVVLQSHRVAWSGPDAGRLSEIAREFGLLNLPWVWTLPHDQYQLHLVEVPELPDDEIRGALQLRVKDLISTPLEQAAIDSLLLPEQAFRGRNRMAFALAAARHDTDPIEDIFGRAGIRLERITAADVALRNLAALTAQAHSSAVMDMTATDAHLNATFDRELCLNRTLSLGYHDLAAGFQADASSGGETDTEFDFDLEPAPDAGDAPAVDTQLDAMALELQRSFDYFDTQLGLGGIETLRILSDYPVEERVYAYLNDRFGVQTGQLNLSDHADLAAHADPTHNRETAMAVASTLFLSGEPV